jgi:hypothetical protein
MNRRIVRGLLLAAVGAAALTHSFNPAGAAPSTPPPSTPPTTAATAGPQPEALATVNTLAVGTIIEVPMPPTKFCPYVPGVVGDADCVRSAVVNIQIPAGTWDFRTRTFDPEPEVQPDENVRVTAGSCQFTTTALTSVREVVEEFRCTLTEPVSQVSFLFATPDDNRIRSVFLQLSALELIENPPTSTTTTVATTTTLPVTTTTVATTTTVPGTIGTTPSTAPTTTAPTTTPTVAPTTTLPATSTTRFQATSTVVAPPATAAPGGNLPFTGSDSGNGVLLGVGLIALGLGVAGTARGLRRTS